MSILARAVLTFSLLVALVSAPIAATTLSFEAQLSQAWAPEFAFFPVGGTGSAATGSVTFDYDTVTHTAFNVQYDVVGLSVADLLGVPSQHSHVHATGLTDFILYLSNLVFVDVPGGITLSSTGPVVAELTYESDLLAGTAWINLHTALFPNGEIAGVVNLVPEPTAGLLLLLAAGYWRTRTFSQRA